MGKLLTYANNKDKLDNNIAEETKRLYLEGLNYNVALRKAKELYFKEEIKNEESKETKKET